MRVLCLQFWEIRGFVVLSRGCGVCGLRWGFMVIFIGMRICTLFQGARSSRMVSVRATVFEHSFLCELHVLLYG